MIAARLLASRSVCDWQASSRPFARSHADLAAVLRARLVTEEPSDMPEDVQRQALEAMAAGCAPASGCVGSWTMHSLRNGNEALLISSPPNVNAVVWIHSGGIRYQLMGPAASFSASAALEVADLIEQAAS